MSWVEERRKRVFPYREDCRADGVFEKLRSRLALDASTYNAAEGKPHGWTIQGDISGHEYSLSRTDGSGTVMIRRGNDRITVTGDGAADAVRFVVTFKWNEAEAVCELAVDGYRATPSEISEKALAPLFFG